MFRRCLPPRLSRGPGSSPVEPGRAQTTRRLSMGSRGMNRRKFLAATAGAAGLGLTGRTWADDTTGAATIGSGKWAYTAVPGWGTPPDGMKYDMGCAVVVDSHDRVYVHSHA